MVVHAIVGNAQSLRGRGRWPARIREAGHTDPTGLIYLIGETVRGEQVLAIQLRRPVVPRDCEVWGLLGHRWEAAEATVVARQVRTQRAGFEPNYDYVVDVRPASGPPLRATIHEGFAGPAGGFAPPAVGAVIGVLYEAKSQKVKFDNADPRLSRAGSEQSAADAFAAAASAQPGNPAAAGLSAGPQVVSGAEASAILGAVFSGQEADVLAAIKGAQSAEAGDPTDRFARLQALKDNGVLTEAEYEAQRQRIISEI